MHGTAECPGNAKHTWNSMKFSQSVSLVIVMMHFLQCGRSYWEATGGDDALYLSIQRDDVVLGGLVRAQFGGQRKTTRDGAKGRL